MVFTSVSTTVLRFFNCVEYDSVDANGRLKTLRVLQADHGISCDSPSYKKWSVYAGIMVFIYPVGIPLLYFAELWYHRKAINPDVVAGYAVINPDASAGAPPAADAPPDGDAPPAGLTIMTEKDVQELKIKRRSEDKSIQHLEFLFRDYEPRTYLFIVFECVRRLALTGMLIFIFPGSASQIVVGLFVAVFSQLIIAAAGPYHEDQDDTLATVGQFQIVLVFISSFVLLVKDIPQQQDGAGDLWKGPAFAAFMLLIGTMTLLMTLYTLICDSALAQSVYTRYSRWRHRNRVKPAEAEAPAPAPSPAPAPCVAEAPVPAASTVEAEAPAAPSLGVSQSGRPRTVVRRGEPRDVVADPAAVADAPPPSLALSKRPRTAPTAPSLGVSLSGRPRAVIRQGEPRDPGGSLRVRAMAQRAVARPLHAGPPSRRPPPLQPSRRPSSR